MLKAQKLRASGCFQVSESFVDGRVKKGESKENVPLWGSGRSSSLYRSRSMDVLPQREPTSTKALCALFESKANPQPSLNSSPPQHSTAATGCKTRGERPLQDRVCLNNPSAQVKYRFYKAIKTHPPDFITLNGTAACMRAFLPGAKKKAKPVMRNVYILQPSACKQKENNHSEFNFAEWTGMSELFAV